MARLTISLLGAFSVVLEDRPITGFTTDKVRALLAYLALAGDKPVRREILAALLWPDGTEANARNSLRQALFQLRHVLGDRGSAPPLLLAEQNTIQLSTTNCWVDVSAFESLLRGCEAHSHGASSSCASCLDRIERAVALYRGEFLQGISVAGSQELEEWALFKQEELHRQALAALGKLVEGYAAGSRLDEAIRHARRQIGLEPWNEEAHRQLMLVLALSGQRSVALQEYEACRAILAAELNVEPSRDTRALYEGIRDGKVRAKDSKLRTEGVRFNSEQSTATPEHPLPGDRSSFVARDSELAQMNRHLEAALAGQGRVVFVVGEAGSGKTALMAEFARRAMETHADLVVASGNCNAQTGLGDPYLPFREVLRELSGDMEGLRASRTISHEHSRRLQDIRPDMVRALLEEGSDLIDLFVPARSVDLKADPIAAPWRDKLEKLLERRAVEPQPASSRQDMLFEQTTSVLLALARRHPLLLMLDDLQWADSGSVSLLFHLGRRLSGNRIIFLGAYRPEEAVKNPAGARHELESVVNELERSSGEASVDLSMADGRQFVEELIDAEPNRLGQEFREKLYRHTDGHALATVEILRGLEERGDLKKDEEGCWIEGSELDWKRLPKRVEAVMAERIGRLPQEQQTLLEVASVEGEEFTAEVAARVLSLDQRTAVRALSATLSREHRLVSARTLDRFGDRQISRYRFRHGLFAVYLYRRMDEVERAHLHMLVAEALETVYGEHAKSERAIELAHHFEEAGMGARAADYLLEAGNNALRLYGWNEAQRHFEKGLALLAALPGSAERDRLEVDLQLALGSALLAADGFGSRRQIAAYTRAYELSRKLGERVRLWPALHTLANSSTARGEYQQALELGEQLLDLAQSSSEDWLLALAHFTLGATLFSSGISLVRSREHLEQAILFYERESNPEWRRFLTSVNAFDVGVNARAWLATVLWILGYPDQAVERAKEALALAQRLDHFLSLVLALYAASHAYQHRCEDKVLGECVQQLQRLISGKQLLIGQVWVEVFGGWLMVREGKEEEGLLRIREGTEAWQRAGAIFGTTAQLIVLAEACILAGRRQEGLEAVEKGLALVERTGARSNEADLFWLKGELLQALSGDTVEAERCLHKAMEISREQEARSYQLRVATSLARLWQRQGRSAEAQQLSAEAYGWFTEGFDTPDLTDARDLLQELRREHQQAHVPAAQMWTSPA